MGEGAQLRLKGFPQGRYVRIRFNALPAEFVTTFRSVLLLPASLSEGLHSPAVNVN